MGRSGRGPGTPCLSQVVSPALRSRGLMLAREGGVLRFRVVLVSICTSVGLGKRERERRERERERERESLLRREGEERGSERELMRRRVFGGSLCSRKSGGRRPRFIGIG